MKRFEKILIILSLICLITIGIALVLIIMDQSWYELQGAFVWIFALYTIITIGLITLLTGFLSKSKNLLKLSTILIGYTLATFLVNGIEFRFGANQSISNWLNLVITGISIFLILKNTSKIKKKKLNETK